MIEIVRDLKVVDLVSAGYFGDVTDVHVFYHLLVRLAEAAVVEVVVAWQLFHFLYRPDVFEEHFVQFCALDALF